MNTSIEQVSLVDIAKDYQTPCFVYSKQMIIDRLQQYTQAFGTRSHLIAYSVKANSNLSILQLLAQQGAGFDIVSVGELERVLLAGGSPKKVVFSGVGKQAHEIVRALECGIACFNVESISELELIQSCAQSLGTKAPISLRVNPNIDAKTHPYISTGLSTNKFGIAIEEALDFYALAAQLSHIEITGIDCHIGSQITEIDPFEQAANAIKSLYDQCLAAGHTINHIDLGGGLGIPYAPQSPTIAANTLIECFCSIFDDPQLRLMIEPGRSIIAEAGYLLTKVVHIKHTKEKRFAIIDAAMNDLIRPVLYQGWHSITNTQSHQDVPVETYQIVGPICESADFLGHDRDLALKPGDLLVIEAVGAYGSSMGSNYNSRLKPAEVLVDGEQHYLIASRETLEQLTQRERLHLE